MSEQQNTPDPQAGQGDENAAGQVPPASVTPPEGESQTGETTPDPTDSGDGGKNDAELKRARKEAAEYRRKLRDVEAQLEAAKLAELSDLERAQADAKAAGEKAAAAEARAQKQALKAAVIGEATKNGFASPELAVQLLTGSVEFDDDGEPVGVSDLVKNLATKHPELINIGGASAGGAPGAANPGQLPGTETKEAMDIRLGLVGGGQSFF